MITIIGTSFEKILIKDLNDTIYYRQKKNYTDQQYEQSRDLQKEIRKGRITIYSSSSALANSEPDTMTEVKTQSSGPSLQEIRTIVKDSVSSSVSSIKDMFPMMVDMVRKEISEKLSSITISGGNIISSGKKSTFKGPNYIPSINTDDLKSNVIAEKREVSGNSLSEGLAALKRLKK